MAMLKYPRKAFGGRLLSIALAFAAALTVCGISAHAADLNLTCTGDHYRHSQPFPMLESVTLQSTGSKPMEVGLPDVKGPVKGSILADNPIQLKFKAGDLTGQYFKLTGKLFIVHDDGRLTRMVCKPS
jgi:hypothetical protein